MIRFRVFSAVTFLALNLLGSAAGASPWTPSGACCIGFEPCVQFSEEQCDSVGGAFFGAFSECEPDPCPQPPTGACCAPDGSCVTLVRTACTGTYLGDDSTCDPNPCPQPPREGACCLGGEGCEFLSEGQCLEQGGSFFGGDSSCSPTLCAPPLPTEPSTWGNIKRRYR
jgi:hypothetical protein